jgi:hypothetical protein
LAYITGHFKAAPRLLPLQAPHNIFQHTAANIMLLLSILKKKSTGKILVQHFAVKIRFLPTMFKEGAGNGFFWLIDTHLI